jgi:hypothetical protein
MARIDLGDRHIPIPPYFQVFDVHHAINREKFYQEATSNPAFQVCVCGGGGCSRAQGVRGLCRVQGREKFHEEADSNPAFQVGMVLRVLGRGRV